MCANKIVSIDDSKSLETLGSVLTPQRIHILQTLIQNKPKSLTELSSLADVHLSIVTESIRLFESLGIVSKEREGRNKRPILLIDKFVICFGQGQKD